MSSSYYGNVATGGWAAPAMPHHQDQFYAHQSKYGGYSESQSYYNHHHHQYHQAAAAVVAAAATTPSPPFRYPPTYPQSAASVQCNASVSRQQNVAASCTPPAQITPSPSASSSPESRTSYSPSASGSPVSAFEPHDMHAGYANSFAHHHVAPHQPINPLEQQHQQQQVVQQQQQRLNPAMPQNGPSDAINFNNVPNAYDIHQRAGYQNGALHPSGAGYCVKNSTTSANYFPNWMQAYAGNASFRKENLFKARIDELGS